jgi:poly-gamma-glutamate capsule biosynthesis protein CapA/YwtB (metallophosphatase superfamily)
VTNDQGPRSTRRPPRRRRRRRGRVALALLAAMLAALLAVALLGADRPPPAALPAAAEIAVPTRSGVAPAPVARAAAARPIRVAAVGDTVMGSLPYGLPPDGGRSLFSRVDHLLVGDVVIGNLEGTLATGGASKCGQGRPNCFAFRTPPSYARWLREAGFTVMSLANNHAYDFGADGLRQTVAALARVGVRSTGRPGTMALQRVGGRRVAVLGFAPYGWSDPLLDLPGAARRVREAARRAEIVVVTFHGGAEGRDRTRTPRGPETYLGEPRGDVRAFAKAVVDAGADLVIGHGPHVLRGMEVYRGRLVAYSLGNFAGYKALSLGGPLSTGAVLQVALEPDGRLRRGRIRPIRLVGDGIPAPGGDAIGLVRRLSLQDFGARAPRIDAHGVIRPPLRR